MKEKIPKIVLLSVLLVLVSSCSIIEHTFKSGIGIIAFFAAVILAVLVLVIKKLMDGYKILMHYDGNLNF
ncbi:hypothetical protein [Flavobacterium sp.]|uniref:hypothetical protein n=1 Tax=Flavobacterium sp. TaxID=239 RepID=UPI00286D856A|nr:hypothetical protein [Flavobacterium sp.]